MTRECYNVWIDTNNDMSEIDMMMCEPATRYVAPACGSVSPKGISGVGLFGIGGVAGSGGQFSTTIQMGGRSLADAYRGSGRYPHESHLV